MKLIDSPFSPYHAVTIPQQQKDPLNLVLWDSKLQVFVMVFLSIFESHYLLKEKSWKAKDKNTSDPRHFLVKLNKMQLR